MVRPQDTLTNGQGTLMERLGLTVATLGLVDCGQVVAAAVQRSHGDGRLLGEVARFTNPQLS